MSRSSRLSRNTASPSSWPDRSPLGQDGGSLGVRRQVDGRFLGPAKLWGAGSTRPEWTSAGWFQERFTWGRTVMMCSCRNSWTWRTSSTASGIESPVSLVMAGLGLAGQPAPHTVGSHAATRGSPASHRRPRRLCPGRNLGPPTARQSPAIELRFNVATVHASCHPKRSLAGDVHLRRQAIDPHDLTTQPQRRNQGPKWKTWTDRQPAHARTRNDPPQTRSDLTEIRTGGSRLKCKRPHVLLN